jgi:hypothetical protein
MSSQHASGASRFEALPMSTNVSVKTARLQESGGAQVYGKDDATPREARQGFATFSGRYNAWRQCQALGYQTPASVSAGAYV